MGCQCANQKEEDINDELIKKNSLEEGNGEEQEQEQDNNNFEQKDGIFGLTNQEETGQNNFGQSKNENNENNMENEEEQENHNFYNEKINDDKNTKYADYPEKMLELINKIREDPVSYAEVIEELLKIALIKNIDMNYFCIQFSVIKLKQCNKKALK